MSRRRAVHLVASRHRQADPADPPTLPPTPEAGGERRHAREKIACPRNVVASLFPASGFPASGRRSVRCRAAPSSSSGRWASRLRRPGRRNCGCRGERSPLPGGSRPAWRARRWRRRRRLGCSVRPTERPRRSSADIETAGDVPGCVTCRWVRDGGSAAVLGLGEDRSRDMPACRKAPGVRRGSTKRSVAAVGAGLGAAPRRRGSG